MDEDISKQSEIVGRDFATMLKTIGSVDVALPSFLKYFAAKYYLIFIRANEPLRIVEQIFTAYNRIHRGQVAEYRVDKYVQQFITLNQDDDTVALGKLVDDVAKDFNIRLQVVSRWDAVKFLLYEKAYPHIMQHMRALARVYYDAYLNRLLDQKDFNLRLVVRTFVAVHDRLEFVKRIFRHLESYLPPLEVPIDDSSLDYLDDLEDILEANTYRLWRFVEGSTYIATTDEWIASTVELLRDLFTIVPYQELSIFVDAVSLNSNNRRALVALRHESSFRALINRRQFTNFTPAENVWDVLNVYSEAAVDKLVIWRRIIHDIATGTRKFSEEAFTEYINNALAPHNMSTQDVSDELLSIVSRIFTRINSIEGQYPDDSEQKILDMNLQYVRSHLRRVRDAIRNVAPEQSEASHIELEALLQLAVNKFGAFAALTEKVIVDFYNSAPERRLSEELVKDKVDFYAQKLYTLASLFQTTGKKPSELMGQRLWELDALFDLLVDVLNM